jgi:hypothetical protein
MNLKKSLISIFPFNLIKTLGENEKGFYEVMTPILMEVMVAETVYNNSYRTLHDVSRKNYGNISSLLKYCLEWNLNGKDMQRTLKLILKDHTDLLAFIDQVLSNSIETANLEKLLLLFRIFESKARRKYQEYTLKLNSLISIFFFYVFLIPIPVVLISEFLPQISHILLPIFFVSNILIFRIFFNKIRRIRSVLLG